MARKKSELVEALNNSAISLGYIQCEWVADGRCLYPGTFSPNLQGGGPWYCQFHDACRDPIFGASVVVASRDYKHPTETERAAEHLARAKDAVKALGMDRKEGESADAYRKRCLDYLKQKTVLRRMRNAA